MVLTKARGGRRGHSRIMCPLAPHYRHNPLDNRLRLSAGDRRLKSVCIGSGGSLVSGWRVGGVAMATEVSVEQDCMRLEQRMANWINFSNPCESS